MSDSTETLTFKIGLSGTYHSKAPAYIVSINEHEYASGQVEVESDEIFYVTFDAGLAVDDIAWALADGSRHALKIKLTNKEDSDVIQNDDKTAIVKDLLLNITSIEIDEIDLGSLIWSHSVYRLDTPHEFNGTTVTELVNCVNLGWNGTWELGFNTPFYIWLLENL